jgi:DNA replication protein DnaD
MFELDERCRTFGVTAVENLFLAEYMPTAKGDFVKVYLFALYRSQLSDQELSLEEMAEELGQSTAEVQAALRYWERRRLLTRLSEQPLRYRLYHLGERLLSGQDAQAADADYISFAEAVYAVFQNERKIRPSEIAQAYEWVSELQMSREVVLMLLNYCKDTRGKSFTFKAAEKLAVQMLSEGITTPEEAENYLGHSKVVHEGARAVLRRFNMRRQPTEDELALYRKWTDDWQFMPDGILAACAETVKASNPSFGYLNGVLDGLRRRGAGGQSKQVELQLEKESTEMHAAREVLLALGMRINPASILTAYSALRKLAPHDMILQAAKAVAQRRGRFEDIEPQLTAWKKKGIVTSEQAAAAPIAPPAAKARTVRAQQYQQREYSEEELSQSVRDMLEEARKYDKQ